MSIKSDIKAAGPGQQRRSRACWRWWFNWFSMVSTSPWCFSS